MTDTHQLLLKIPLAKHVCNYAKGFPKLRAAYSNLILDFNALLREGRLTCNTLYVPNSGATLFLNQKDNRGRRLFRKGTLSPHLLSLWQSAIHCLNPAVTLDVGANYGEFTISTKYPKDTKAICFEPNPAVAKFLKRSIASHSAKNQITLKQAAAGAEPSQTLALHIDEKWSGTTSIAQPEQQSTNHQSVESTSVDHVIASLAPSPTSDQSLVFKIDVEGYEPYVFQGMPETFKSFPNFIGLVELNCTALRAAGSDPETFLRHLQSLGEVACITREGIQSLPNQEFTDQLHNDSSFQADLILSSSKPLLDSVVAKNHQSHYLWKRSQK